MQVCLPAAAAAVTAAETTSLVLLAFMVLDASENVEKRLLLFPILPLTLFVKFLLLLMMMLMTMSMMIRTIFLFGQPVSSNQILQEETTARPMCERLDVSISFPILVFFFN